MNTVFKTHVIQPLPKSENGQQERAFTSTENIFLLTELKGNHTLRSENKGALP